METELKSITAEESKIKRYTLSNEHIDEFYKMLEINAKDDMELDLLKNIFFLTTLKPDIGTAEISERLHISRDLSTVLLRLVYRVIRSIESDEDCEDVIQPKQILHVRPPRPYLYIDQYGKKWACMNEFFGMT